MTRNWLVLIGLWVASGAASGTARAELRDPTPEQVTVVASLGGLRPDGRFRKKVDGGFAVGAGGTYALTRFLAPAFAVQYAPLEPDESKTGVRGSIDSLFVLGGLRLFLVPRDYRLRPWVTLLGGWAHYTSHRTLPLEPIFAPGRTTRNDPILSVGGGIDLGLHPNFSVGADIRENVSYTDDRKSGERDLSSVTIFGSLSFHY